MYDNQMYAPSWPQSAMPDGQQQRQPMQPEFYPPVSDPNMVLPNMNHNPTQFVDPSFVQPGMHMNGHNYTYPQQHPDPAIVPSQPMIYNVEQQMPQNSPQNSDKKGLNQKSTNKKRRKCNDAKSDPEDSPDNNDDDAADGKGKSGFLRLPDVIDKLASEKQVLIFDNEAQLYVVKDGPGFEAQFNELRYTRGKKSEGTSNRPFSRMHTYFVLVRGERWAGTGSAFKAKDATKVVPPGDLVQASNINVTLMPSNETSGFQVTLQHFLNVTGAGDLYRKAKSKMGEKEGSSKNVKAENTKAQTDSTSSSWPSSSACSPGSPASAEDFFDDYQSDTILDASNVSQLLGNIWTADSRGDQGYFFRRAEGFNAFENGAIVMLVDGKLQKDDSPQDGSMYMVVSDKNVKWKGEPIPTPEEEGLGHWCCFLGQVPVIVDGPIRSGEYVGPKGDGSGMGKVARLGEAPVVGIALASKESSAPQVVKTMCFAGLNAMSRNVGEDFTKVFEQAKQTQSMVEDVAREVAKVEDKMDVTEGNVLNLSQRLARMERRFMGAFQYPVVVPGLPVNDGDWRAAGAPGSGRAGWLGRNRMCLGVLVGIACTLALVLGIVLSRRPPPPRPPPKAQMMKPWPPGSGGNGNQGIGGGLMASPDLSASVDVGSGFGGGARRRRVLERQAALRAELATLAGEWRR